MAKTFHSRAMLPTYLLRVLVIAAALNSVPMRLNADEAVDESAVRRWVARLDVNRKSDRDEAKKELLKLGPAVLKWLPEPESLGSRATAEAIRDVRAKLERQKAEESVNATRLTPAGSQSLGHLLQRLTQETGNLVGTDDLSKLSRSVELPGELTFWSVIESAAKQQDLSWSFSGSPAHLTLSPSVATADSPQSVLAVTQAKAFRLALKSIRERTVVGEKSGPLLRLELDVMSEPRLRPLFLKCSVAEVALSGSRKTDKGEPADTGWQPFSPDAKLELTFGQGHRQMSVPLDFRRPEGDWSSLSFSGKLHVETAAGEEPLEFPAGKETQGVSRRRGGVTVKVLRWESGVAAKDNGLEVTALVTYDTGGPAFESHRSWMLYNVAGLVRAGMMPAENPINDTARNDVILLKPTHIDSDVQPDGSIAVTYRFEKLPLPASEYRFRYVAPTLILDVPLDFELRGVPLRSGR